MSEHDHHAVLVTGAAVRIGSALANKFAAAGRRVVLHYNDSCDEAEKTLKQLPNQDLSHNLARADLTNPAAVEAIFREAGPVDVLVNNAAVFRRRPLAEEGLDEAKRQFDVNFWAPMELMKAFKRQCPGEGCVVNMLDQRVAKVNPGGGSYPLSKKALAEATLAAALQWAPTIRVNAVAPGPALPPRGLENSRMRLELADVPLGRPVDLEDLAAACLLLVENRSITGQILFVDGGQHLVAGRGQPLDFLG